MTLPIVRKTPGRAAALLARLRARPNDPVAAASAAKLAEALRSVDRCQICGRQLETEASRRIGIGPECRRKEDAVGLTDLDLAVASGSASACRKDDDR